jgi:deoxyribodipyrimidine photo-lyase
MKKPKIFNLDRGQKLTDKQTALFWFRRDLRIDDNAGLFHALRSSHKVLPIFIFDTVILDQLDDKKDRRVQFIFESLELVKRELEDAGSSLLILYGNPVEIFQHLTPAAVYTNHDYEPYAKKRDAQIRTTLASKGVQFTSFKDQVIFEKDEIVKDDKTPYTVYTPYSRKWKTKLNEFYLKSYPTKKYLANLKKVSPIAAPSLEAIGFENDRITFPPRVVKKSIIDKYHQFRDFPAVDGTTHLGVHLRFGTVSIRKLARLALSENETWLNELIWREFFQMILWHFPHVEKRCFKPAYDHIEWRNDEKLFEAWCEGRTGYPIVDAGMREMNATGFMHNRVRMITASFLTKHLLIDWRWGEAYFAKKLLDYELASNNGNWQWAASCGCDAAPYFRVFNPELQAKKFDADMSYIRKWVPEVGTHEYPSPIVDHETARGLALEIYARALENKK